MAELTTTEALLSCHPPAAAGHIRAFTISLAAAMESIREATSLLMLTAISMAQHKGAAPTAGVSSGRSPLIWSSAPFPRPGILEQAVTCPRQQAIACGKSPLRKRSVRRPSWTYERARLWPYSAFQLCAGAVAGAEQRCASRQVALFLSRPKSESSDQGRRSRTTLAPSAA